MRPEHPPYDDRPTERCAHRLTLDLDSFTHDALHEEATRLGVAIEQLACFAVHYYLADLDSGRIARQGPPPLSPDETHPLGKLLDG